MFQYVKRSSGLKVLFALFGGCGTPYFQWWRCCICLCHSFMSSGSSHHDAVTLQPVM